MATSIVKYSKKKKKKRAHTKKKFIPDTASNNLPLIITVSRGKITFESLF